MDNINTPEELLKLMNSINYGFAADNNIYTVDHGFEENVFEKWRLSSPERLLEKKYGHCYDQVEFEREWFTKHNYKIHTYYEMFLLPYENPYSTHTFLVYEDNNKYYLFEHADFFHRGIHEFSSLKELLDSEQQRLIDYNNNQYHMQDEEIKKYTLYEYEKPEYGIKMIDFIDGILEKGKKIR